MAFVQKTVQIISAHHTWNKGDHVQAMKILDDIATGKVFGYESDVVPTWEEARQLYDTKGREVGRAAREKKEIEQKN